MIYIIFSTDVWLSLSSYKVECVATSLSHAIVMIKQNAELIEMVNDNDGCIIIEEYKKNSNISTRVFDTQCNESDKNQII